MPGSLGEPGILITETHPVIVIFASSQDPSAASLVERWADHNASLLTCNDLSIAGWRHYLNPDAAEKAVVSGRVLPVKEIGGVLIRWPGVFAEELVQIAPDDRSYVAQEMMAFLVSWFSSLRCPVINRPTPLNLMGPAWRLEQWTYVAAQLGIPVRPVHRRIANNVHDNGRHQGAASVTVVNERGFGDVDQTLLNQARSLARAAGVSVLQVFFSGPEAGSFFAGVDLIPQITGEVEDAVLELLLDSL